MKKYIYLTFVASLFFACKAKKAQEDSTVTYVQEELFSDLLDKGLEEDKLVFLDFYTDWCLPCKMMDEDVFSDESISSFFNSNFINMKVNAEKNQGPDMSIIYNVKAYPTLIFVNGKGQEVLRREGMLYHTDLMNFANQAIRLHKNQ